MGAVPPSAAGRRRCYTKAEVTIGTAGATAEQEDVHVTAISKNGAAIGNGQSNTTVIIQGHTTIERAISESDAAIGDGSYPICPGDTSITIRDNATIGYAGAKDSAVIGASDAK